MATLWKKLNMKEAENDIIEIEDGGHEVMRYTDYHWKINNIDVWPSSKKYMGKDKVVRKFNKLSELIK